MNLKFLTNILSLFNKNIYRNNTISIYEMKNYILTIPNMYNYEDHLDKKIIIIKDN